MRYTYIIAWTVAGGVGLHKSADPVELFSSPHARFVLTRDPGPLLEPLNRRDAMAAALMHAFTGHSVVLHEYAEAHIEAVAAKRSERQGGAESLVCIFTGEADVAFDEEKWPERNGHIMSFEAVDTEAIATRHKAEEEAMKTALCLESPAFLRPLASGVYLMTERGVPVYSIAQHMSVTPTIMSPLDEGAPARFDARYRALLEADDLRPVPSLSALFADAEANRLRQFLFGWAALEAFVMRAFRAHKNACNAKISAERHPAVVEYSRDRSKAGSAAKRFAAVAAVVFPHAPEDEARADYSRFYSAMQIRNDFYHGNRVVTDEELPASEVAELLSKYLRGYLELVSRLSDDAARMQPARDPNDSRAGG